MALLAFQLRAYSIIGWYKGISEEEVEGACLDCVIRPTIWCTLVKQIVQHRTFSSPILKLSNTCFLPTSPNLKKTLGNDFRFFCFRCDVLHVPRLHFGKAFHCFLQVSLTYCRICIVDTPCLLVETLFKLPKN